MITVPNHAGDRVIYEGRNWRVPSFTGHPYYYAELIADDGSGDMIPQINMSNLHMSWCPESHGGKGNFTVSPGDVVRVDSGHIDMVVCGVTPTWITVMWGDNNRQQVSRSDITSITRAEVKA